MQDRNRTAARAALPWTWQPSSAPAAAPAHSQFTNSVAVVTQYYQDITILTTTPTAWNLGGSNIAAKNGQSYDSWSTGPSTPPPPPLSSATPVEFRRSADQHQRGPVRTALLTNTYYGTYNVTNGVITSACSIAQTS